MRIVIDLQGAQSKGSRNRGVGRYTVSLAQAIIRNRGEHEIILALNGAFPDTIEPIRAAFDGLIGQEAIRVWQTPGPVGHVNNDNNWRRHTAELVREAFFASLSPDIVLISSLFEGLDDDVVTSVASLSLTVPTAVVLYDLIPLIQRSPYLENPVIESWYENKLDHLRRADLLLAISESSRQEGLQYLGFPSEKIINVSTAADPQFGPQQIDAKREQEVRERYALDRPFVMYTGGIDHRKNIEGLIRAYANLPRSLRSTHQLAIVCSIQPASRVFLTKLAKKQGLAADELVLTGFVPDNDLLALYNLCKLFVFPSWHEGFGLPALEAMCCGRAVIGANTSSLPEVIGREDALFDPHNDESITNKIAQALTDDIFRHQLELHGLKQAKLFSWDASSKAAIAAFEIWHKSQADLPKVVLASAKRPKLAYVSPLPPLRSGISDYSAELLPELARQYEIDVIVTQDSISVPWINANYKQRDVEWFKANADNYDRVLYHFGNNHLHQHMFDLIENVPGIVVLHDFFLSGIVRHMDLTGYAPGMWDKALYADHGYAPLRMRYQEDDIKVIWNYPNNLDVLNKAKGLIVHSENSLGLAKHWYGAHASDGWAVVPLLRTPALEMNKSAARIALDIGIDDFVVCSFGFLSPTKLNRRLLDAWLSSQLAGNKNCVLIFVGENNGESYGAELLQSIQTHPFGERVCITGWVDTDTFHQYLAAADIGVQLRTLSRGETSAAVLDCMNYGIPTIVNAHGSLADLPADAVWMLPDEFSDAQLIEALETLWWDRSKRQNLSSKARETILTDHSPRGCADQYAEAIESMYRVASTDISSLTRALVDVDPTPVDINSLFNLATTIDQSITPRIVARQLLIDVSDLIHEGNTADIGAKDYHILRELLINPPAEYRVEPVYITADRGYCYARQFTLQFLGCPDHILNDDVIEFRSGDIFFGLHSEYASIYQQEHFYQLLRRHGVQVLFMFDRQSLLGKTDEQDWPTTWLSTAAQCDGVICLSREDAIKVENLLPAVTASRLRPFYIGILHMEKRAFESKESDMDVTGTIQNWSQDTQTIIDIIVHHKWMMHWIPDGGYRYFGSDIRLRTQVGKRKGFTLQTTGAPGCLFHGPYLSLPAGRYVVRIHGYVNNLGSTPAYADIATQGGNVILSPHILSLISSPGLIGEMGIFLKTAATDFEVRVWVAADSDLSIHELEILPEGLLGASANCSENLTLLDFPRSTSKNKIGWLTTWNTKCGIATYSEHLISNLHDEVTIFAANQDAFLRKDGRNCYRSWNAGKDGNNLHEVTNLIISKSLNTIIIQFNYGFFNFPELIQFIEEQLISGRIVIFMMHSTVDPYGDTENWKLSELRDVLSRCHRILVHSNSDLNRLNALGLVENVSIFPHGIWSFEAVKKDKTVSPISDFPLIATYGFCLPHKGLKELIEAASLLKKQGTPIRLRLVNAEYPNPVSTNLIQDLRNLIVDLSLDSLVEFHNEYLEDEQSFALLRDADLLVFPYQVTGESSSAAVRSGLATKRPVAVTPLSIFEDLGESVFRFSGISPSDMAQGIIEIFDDISTDSERFQTIDAEANRWRDAHDCRAVSARLHEMCINLLNNNVV